MCGIAGIWRLDGSSVPEAEITRFTDSMIHRGPDGSGITHHDDGRLALGHRRLSILDLSEAGKQPMCSNDGRFTISFNGEVFNFLDLKNELKGLGYVFHSDTDTEVVLHAYAEWGASCLHRFNGMWAFAIWDNFKRELFLARDRFGIKPLYFVYHPNELFAFASETRAFKFLEGFNRELDESLLSINHDDPFALEGNGLTIFKGIYSIPSGHLGRVGKNDSFKLERWYENYQYQQRERVPYSYAKNRFTELLFDAINLRLISDVPIAVALSGGLDSTSILAVLCSLKEDNNQRRLNKDQILAVTLDTQDKSVNEIKSARQLSKHLGVSHQITDGSGEQLIDRLVSDTRTSDYIGGTPITGIADIYRVMGKAGYPVSIDGHGVDELLFGYRSMIRKLVEFHESKGDWFKAYSTRRILRQMHSANTRSGSCLSDAYLTSAAIFSIGRKRQDAGGGGSLSANSLFKARNHMISLGAQFVEFDLSSEGASAITLKEFYQTSLPTILRNFDRAGMIASVEVRMPYMDYRIVELCHSLPLDYKLKDGFNKRILRDSVEGLLHDRIRLKRQKIGVSSPMKEWMEKDAFPLAMDLLKDFELREQYEHAVLTGALNMELARNVWKLVAQEIIMERE